jgi:hypothetical protein
MQKCQGLVYMDSGFSVMKRSELTENAVTQRTSARTSVAQRKQISNSWICDLGDNQYAQSARFAVPSNNLQEIVDVNWLLDFRGNISVSSNNP